MTERRLLSPRPMRYWATDSLMNYPPRCSCDDVKELGVHESGLGASRADVQRLWRSDSKGFFTKRRNTYSGTALNASEGNWPFNLLHWLWLAVKIALSEFEANLAADCVLGLGFDAFCQRDATEVSHHSN